MISTTDSCIFFKERKYKGGWEIPRSEDTKTERVGGKIEVEKNESEIPKGKKPGRKKRLGKDLKQYSHIFLNFQH